MFQVLLFLFDQEPAPEREEKSSIPTSTSNTDFSELKARLERIKRLAKS